VPPGIHVVHREGEAPAPLGPNPSQGRFPRWSADGRRLAFYSSRRGTAAETFVVGSDGTGLTQLTEWVDSGSGVFPQWSPDGSKILTATGVRYGGTLYLFDVDTPWSRQSFDTLPSPPGDPELRYRPWSWSPDGRWLATYSERGAGLALFNFDSRRWEIVTGSGERPRWLSDSRRLVYSDGGRLFLFDLRIRRPQEVYSLPGYRLVAVDPGPGDSALYFIARREAGDVWMARVR